MRPDCAAAARDSIPPDALLVHRMAALRDTPSLAELYQRYSLTLYALAYSIVLDGEAADTAVARAFREAWRHAASFNGRQNSVGRWLANLTRRATEHRLALPAVAGRTPPSGSAPRAVGALPPSSDAQVGESHEAARWPELVRVAASLVLPALLLE